MLDATVTVVHGTVQPVTIRVSVLAGMACTLLAFPAQDSVIVDGLTPPAFRLTRTRGVTNAKVRLVPVPLLKETLLVLCGGQAAERNHLLLPQLIRPVGYWPLSA